MKYTNPLSECKSPQIKRSLFATAVATGATAVKQDANGNLVRVPLVNTDIDDVEFIGGLWRVQTRPDFEIVRVRDREFVIGQKLDIAEKNGYEYFDAKIVGVNCYGPFIIANDKYIVGRAVTARGTEWAYGKSIPDVRGFLGIAVYDKYMDIINNARTKTR